MNIDTDFQVHDRSFLGSLKRAVAHRGDKPAVRFTDGTDHTAMDLIMQSGRLAGIFAKMGVERGDRVAIMCSNRVEFLWSFFAASWLGAVPAGINVSLRGGTLRHQIDDLSPKVVVCENRTVEQVVKIVGAADPRALNVDTDERFKQLRIDGASLPLGLLQPSGQTELAMITYTSGTTGPSKGTMYNNEMSTTYSECQHWLMGFTPQDVAFNCLPLFHNNSLFCTLIPALRAGSLAVFGPTFSASNFWNTVREQGATILSLLGSMVPILMNRPPSEGDAQTPARIALAVPSPVKLFYQFQERFGIKLTSLYGMSDIGVLIGVPHDMPGRPGKAGIENPLWECAIVDDNDMPVPDGQVGELVTRPRRPNIMQMGYWRNPEGTLAAWRNLWFHTGDYLKRDPDGWYEFIDRKKDAMRRFGENISSFEVETAILSHAAVEDVAVYAVPSSLEEDEVMASIILKPGFSNIAPDLLRHCEAELPYYAVPRYYRIVTEMPKTQTAKVMKTELRKIGVDNLTWDGGPRGRSKRG